MTYIISQDDEARMFPLPTIQISVKANGRYCLLPFLQAPLISVFSVLVSKPQCELPTAFMVSLILHVCSLSHRLHRWRFLTLFGVSSYRVLLVARLPVLLCFWSNKQTLIQPNLYCSTCFTLCVRETQMRDVWKKRPRIPYSMHPIQIRNVDHICEPMALTTGSHREEPQSEWGDPRRGRGFPAGAVLGETGETPN